MIQGEKRENSGADSASVKKLYTGFTKVSVVGINPSRKELNKLMGREDNESDQEIDYVSEDREGNKRVRLSFWLRNDKGDQYFLHSFNITDANRVSKDGTKVQVVNTVCDVTWVPLAKDKDGFTTHEIDEALIPEWISHFTDKDKTVTSYKKVVRKAYSGEEELCTLVKSWLGDLQRNDPQCVIDINMKALFEGDFSELRELISCAYATPFLILLGVKTDEADSTKKYQRVYSKGFLPGSFMSYIDKGLKFPSDYTKRVWNHFKTACEGQYGFDSFYTLGSLAEYDAAADVAAATSAKADVTPTNAKY